MSSITPQQIIKASIKESVTTGKGSDFAIEQMIKLWRDAFPVLRYTDDAAVIEAKQRRESAKPAPTEALAADISFDDIWGDEIDDASAYAGIAVNTNINPDEVKVSDVYGHVSYSMTRAQLSRVGFNQHGGSVVTCLNPMLENDDVVLRIGSHITFNAQRHVIVEIAPVVHWDQIDEYLLTAINCIAG